MFSGGLDSLIAWFYLGKPHCLYVDLGHKYAEKEKEHIYKLQEILPIDVIFDQRLDLGDLEEKDAFIPLRNAFLALIGSYYADEVIIVCQKGELNLSDRDNRFRDLSSLYLEHLWGKEIKVTTPFSNMTKQDMVKWFLKQDNFIKLNLLDILKSSRSCYNNHHKECGQCPACFRKWIALEANNIPCRDWFENDPSQWEGIQTYIKKFKLDQYDAERSEQSTNILRRYYPKEFE
jgi:7-cyano-7-deazaguanine synthase in queuosine biosynthesis